MAEMNARAATSTMDWEKIQGENQKKIDETIKNMQNKILLEVQKIFERDDLFE
jgi:hypothetical protein